MAEDIIYNEMDLGACALTDEGTYDSSKKYDYGNVVTTEDSSYWSIQDDNQGHPVTDREWWAPLALGTSATAAAKAAKEATDATNEAIKNALSMANSANTAAGNANSRAEEAKAAAEQADTSKEAAESATESALAAAKECQEAVQQAAVVANIGLYPTAMEVDYPSEITWGNLTERFITATLSPENTIPNVLFLGDNNAVSVTPDGRLTALKKGTSVIHVIPTGNTSLYRTIEIKVKQAGLSLVDTRTSALLNGDGSFIFN
jgi:hypothetical protein